MTLEKNLVTNRRTEVAKELIHKCSVNVLRILNLAIEQSKHFEMDNHLIRNKYIAQHHSEALATMLEVENEREENLSKLGLSNSVHKSKVQSDDRILDHTKHSL